jgi:hypothetical protein
MFLRERLAADDEYRNAGNDIVLKLVEKYVESKGKENRRLLSTQKNPKGDEMKGIAEDVATSLPSLPEFPPLSEDRRLYPSVIKKEGD